MSKHIRLQQQSYELKYNQRDRHLTPFDFEAADDAEEEFQVIDPDTVDNNPVNLAYEPLAKRTDYDQKRNLKPIIPDWECVAHRAAEFIKNI